MTNLRRSTRKRGNDEVINETTTTTEKNKNDNNNEKAINGSKASTKTTEDDTPPPPPKRVKMEDNEAKVKPPPTDNKEASSEDTKVKSNNTQQQKQTQDVSPPIISAGAASAAMVASKKKPEAAAATKMVLSPSVSSSSDASSSKSRPQSSTLTVIKTEETNIKTESTNGKTIPTTTNTNNTGIAAVASSNTSKSIPPTTTTQPPPQNTKQIPATTTKITAIQQPQQQKEVKTYDQLQNKYSSELHYMLVEFRKLERQLLGAPGNGTTTATNSGTANAGQVKTEAAGSKERREKLHGFILHLEDTIRQITEGCNLEKECNVKGEGEVKKVSDNTLDGDQKKEEDSGAAPNQEERESATPPITTAKEREELVHKLEEHILANLLPVKARLTRQLAAQKGAKLNPATAPVQPGKATEGAGAAPVSTSLSGGTFTATVEAKRKAQEKALLLAQEKARQAELLKHKKPVGSAVPSQYGKVIGGARSSLTSRLHGRILGPPGSNTASGSATTATSSSVPDPTSSASQTPTANTTSGSKTSPSKRPILYAGIAPGSTQVPSSINAVSGVHPGLIDESAVRGVANAEEERIRLAQLEASAARVAGLATTTAGGVTKAGSMGAARAHAAAQSKPLPSSMTAPRPSTIPKQQQPIAKKPKKKHVPLDYNNTSLSTNEVFDMRLKEARWRQCKRRRVRKRNQISGSGSSSGGTTAVGTQAGNRTLIQQPVATTTVPAAAIQQPQQQIPQPPPQPKPSPPQQPKKPPNQRTVEYICAMCNESYPSNSNMNPWWALSSEECPKCGKTQIPRLDITTPVNAMDYHPALLAHIDDGSTKTYNPSMTTSIAETYHQPVQYHTQQAIVMAAPSAATTTLRKSSSFSDSDVSHTDESDGEGGSAEKLSGVNYAESSDEEDELGNKKITVAELAADENGDIDSVTREDCMDREEFGLDYNGEVLSDDEARKLLVLIEHASTCPGRHQSAKHRDVCHSTKYLMLHVRDCSGLLANGDLCPYPWCRKVKHLLYHLVSCEENKTCTICCPPEEKLPSNLQTLTGLNTHRRNKFKERVNKAVLAKKQQMSAAQGGAAKATTTTAAVGTQQLKPPPSQPIPKPAAVQQLKVPTPTTSLSVSQLPPLGEATVE